MAVDKFTIFNFHTANNGQRSRGPRSMHTLRPILGKVYLYIWFKDWAKTIWGFSCLPRRKFSPWSCLRKVYSVSHVPTYLNCFFLPCSYGDRSPISHLGRIFAVGWLLTGLVIIAITMAALTTALTEIAVHSKTTIYGSKVAITWLRTDRYLSPGEWGWRIFFFLEGSHSFQGGRGGINLPQ